MIITLQKCLARWNNKIVFFCQCCVSHPWTNNLTNEAIENGYFTRTCYLKTDESCIQFPADLVTFIEKILNGKLHFLCSIITKFELKTTCRSGTIYCKPEFSVNFWFWGPKMGPKNIFENFLSFFLPFLHFGGVLRKTCSENIQQIYRRSVISIKLRSNFIEFTLWHGCSLVNLLHIF